ncbi:MAG: hypothetical protein E7479_08730 [Ruminococcaceae bacterium]|nr:hypothetical protein [Oscillospiraceae bacterium]
MKKFLAVLLAAIMLFSSCANSKEETEIPESSSKTEAEQSSLPEKEQEFSGVELTEYLRENFPEIDGSTSLIPLEAGIRAEIFGKTIEEATKDVQHSGTWNSFYDLVKGRKDMIFSCPLSEEQKELAKEEGVILEAIPVAYEGFVFVVNAENPVDTLTQDQLRKIYSGEIKNWKELGGNDAEIVAYQRNNDSGSQNYMIEFMGETPLMDAPEEGRPSSMVGLMDAVAYNDNAENAIGYSVYAYAADMYGGGNDIKFIKVDGAEVSKKSMAKGEYPLMGYNYAVFDSEEPEDSPVRRLVEWMTSDEGQLAVAKAGYVTLRDIGFEYEEKYIESYSAVGAGIPKEEIPSYEYIIGAGREEFIPLEVLVHPDGTETYYLEALSNKELEARVNEFICESIKKSEELLPKMKSDLEKADIANGGSSHIFAEFENLLNFFGDSEVVLAYEKGQPASVYVTAKNGYLSVAVVMEYRYHKIEMSEGLKLSYNTETAVWDMKTGKRLSAEELFFEGTDIGKILNEYMRLAVYQPANDLGNYYPMKADFVTMPKEGWNITADRIWFDFNNPYFEGGVSLETDIFLEEYMVSSVPYDMEGCFIGINPVKYFRGGERNIRYKRVEETKETTEKYGTPFGYAVLRNPEESKAYEKINSAIEKYMEKYFRLETVGKELDKKTKDGFYKAWDFTDAKLLGNRYFMVMLPAVSVYIDENNREYYSKTPTIIFDMETGERIEFTDMLTKTGKKRAKTEGFDKFDIIEGFSLDGTKIKVSFVERKTGKRVDIVLNEEDIKW